MLAVYRPFNMSRSFAHTETAGRPVLPSGNGSAGAENQNHSPTAQFASLTTSRPLAALPGVIGAERPSHSNTRDIAGGRPSNNANNSAPASASGGSLSASRPSFQSQPKPRPAISPQSPYSITRPAGVNSLAIIGHRGGHDSTANRHPIQVFSTPASSGG